MDALGDSEVATKDGTLEFLCRGGGDTIDTEEGALERGGGGIVLAAFAGIPFNGVGVDRIFGGATDTALARDGFSLTFKGKSFQPSLALRLRCGV